MRLRLDPQQYRTLWNGVLEQIRDDLRQLFRLPGNFKQRKFRRYSHALLCGQRLD